MPFSKVLTVVKVAVEPADVTLPETGVSPCFKVNVALVSVVGSIYSLKATFTKINGGIDFYNATGVSTTSYTELAFSVYGGPGTNGKIISVKLNKKIPAYSAIIQEGKWVEFKIPLANLFHTATITEVYLQNTFATGVVYFDHVGLR